MTDMKRPPKISDSKFKASHYVQKNFIATPDYGVTLAQVMEESYWGHVARELKSGYTIEVMPEGLPYYAKLIVIHSDEKTRAVVKLLQYVDLVNEAPAPVAAEIVKEVALGSKFKAERNGRWFRVIRVSDQTVMKSGCSTMAEAEAWALENLKTEA
jgi:hypothetical protein